MLVWNLERPKPACFLQTKKTPNKHRETFNPSYYKNIPPISALLCWAHITFVHSGPWNTLTAIKAQLL